MSASRPWLLGAAALLTAATACAESLVLDPSLGSFQVLLRKEGLLKALGHDHVIEVRDYQGRIELEDSAARLRLEIRVDALYIDEPRAREAAGFRQRIKESDRRKIRESMRGPKGLEAARHPLITFGSDRIERLGTGKGRWRVRGKFSLHGVTQTLEFPVTANARPGGSGYEVYGTLRLKPGDFGIEPFSVIGLVKVRDEAEISFRLAAVPPKAGRSP